MIGLLDPAFLLPRTGQDEENKLADELDLLLETCRRHSVALPPFPEYWPNLWNTLGRRLEQSLSQRRAKAALRELRKLGKASLGLIRGACAVGQVWRRGFAQLFAWSPLNGDWEQRMAAAAVRAAMIADHRVVLLVRRVPGRNVKVHSAQNTTLNENTRWVLHIQPRVLGHQQIKCVHHPRNLTECWTTRFDWRLPAVSDRARYPFCPPARWWNHETHAVRTIGSKPAWLNAQQNGWSRPNIAGGTGYHWDVHVQLPATREALGVDQVNVVEFGAPASEGRPGNLHHVPSNQRPRIKDCGWRCP